MAHETVAEIEGKTRVAAYLPDDITKALKIHAVQEDTSVTEIIERLVRAELRRAERKQAIKSASGTERTPEQVPAE